MLSKQELKYQEETSLMDFPALEREVFSKFSSSCLHYLRGFSNLHSQVYQRFLQVFYPLHNSTSFNLPRDLHSLSTILHSTKKHWDSLNISTLQTYNKQPIHSTQEINSEWSIWQSKNLHRTKRKIKNQKFKNPSQNIRIV